MNINDLIIEDGHPIETALEFRRIAIRLKWIEDIDFDILELCEDIAWIGKAISRTMIIQKYLQQNIDPNTWQIITICGKDQNWLKKAYYDSINEKPEKNREIELHKIRSSISFENAINNIKKIIEEKEKKHITRYNNLEKIIKDSSWKKHDDNIIDIRLFRKFKIN